MSNDDAEFTCQPKPNVAFTAYGNVESFPMRNGDFVPPALRYDSRLFPPRTPVTSGKFFSSCGSKMVAALVRNVLSAYTWNHGRFLVRYLPTPPRITRLPVPFTSQVNPARGWMPL